MTHQLRFRSSNPLLLAGAALHDLCSVMRDMKAPTQTLTGYADVSQNAPINPSMRCGPVSGSVAVRTPPSLGEEAGGTGRRAKAFV